MHHSKKNLRAAERKRADVARARRPIASKAADTIASVTTKRHHDHIAPNVEPAESGCRGRAHALGDGDVSPACVKPTSPI